MKKFLCLLLCLTLFAPAALADEDTLAEKFQKQFITGGNGLRGTISLTASGRAEWLTYLQPFTAAELQIRAIGEAQGDKADVVTDDDDWQVKLYAKDDQDEMRGVTYLYGDPGAIYLSSDLLPGTLLTLPAENVQLLYSLARAEVLDLFFSIDPLGMTEAAAGENATAYSALNEILQVSDEVWESQWEPVLEKYYTQLDMWLSAYAAGPVIGGSTGAMTMRTTYTIPAEELKAQAKAIIGMMLYDYDLQALLTPYFTLEQRTIYLNPSLVYFYEACIDALPLNGNIVLEREMSAMGETIGMSFSLPLPALPEEITAPIGEMIANCFSLPYADVMAELDRITVSQSGGDISVSVSSPKRSISFIIDETASNAETVSWDGFVRITPAAGNDEPPLCAAFSYKSSHTVWQDEDWARHDDTTYALSVEPDLSLLSEDDPFRSNYVDFAPLSLNLALNYYNKTDNNYRPVQIEMVFGAQLPDAEIGLTANLRVAEKWAMETLPTTGAENILTLSEERINSLLATLTTNAIITMTSLNTQPEVTPEPAVSELPQPTADSSADSASTPVPPMP